MYCVWESGRRRMATRREADSEGWGNRICTQYEKRGVRGRWPGYGSALQPLDGWDGGGLAKTMQNNMQNADAEGDFEMQICRQRCRGKMQEAVPWSLGTVDAGEKSTTAAMSASNTQSHRSYPQ